jgi:PAS domain S-box-containing protein
MPTSERTSDSSDLEFTRTEAMLAAIVESSDDAIIGKSLDGIIVSWNAGAERIFGYTADEAIGQPVSILSPPERSGEFREILKTVLQGERIDHYETERITKDGRRIHISLTISPIHDASGTIVGVSKIARDITERVRAEQQLQHRSATLEKLIQTGRAISAELDLRKIVQTVTDAATEMTGARFGCFFYNVVEGSQPSYMLFTLSGVPIHHFDKFPMPRATEIFAPTFRGDGTVRLDDVRTDPRYGRNSPYFGIPPGHLPVVSYLAVPVISRSGDVLGGLFFGHPEPGEFTEEDARLVEGLAAQAAIAMDNARLYAAAQEEIQERRRIEQALRAGEERYRLATEAVAGLVYDWDLLKDHVQRSHGLYPLVGYYPHEVPPSHQWWNERVHPDDLERVTRSTLESGGDSYDAEYRVLHRNGHWIHVWDKGVIIRDAGGAPVRVVGSTVDISDRKNAENDRVGLLALEREARADAEAAEQRSAFLAQASAMLSSSLDYQQTLQSVAELAIPRLGDWCAVEMLTEGGEVELLVVAHQDPRKVEWGYQLRERHPVEMDAPAGLPNVLRTGKSEFYPVITDEMFVAAARNDEELQLLREIGYRSLIIVPLVARGRTLGAIEFVITESDYHYSQSDLTLAEELGRRAAIAVDNARLYEQAQLALWNAEQANAAKDQFLAVLSHELRTPLTPVLASVHALEEEKMTGDSKLLVDIIHRNIELEARLIDDLLDLTRIINGKLQLNLQTIDVHPLIHHVIDICRGDIEQKHLLLVVDLQAAQHHVYGDPARLQQVLWNLIKNGIKFTPDGGTVSLRTYDRDGTFHIEVSDTGIGIDPSVLPVIFNAFEQGEGSVNRRFGGMGLGLAITKSLVDMHGGTITATSAGPGMGSEFAVVLPLASATADDDFEARELAEVPHPRTGNIRILLVEDHSDTASLIRLLLERRGYTVYVASSVAMALEVASRQQFDLLISDIGLPDGSGLNLVSWLRANGAVRAIAVSGFGTQEDINRSREAGFALHLVKPFSAQMLHEAIQKVLG